MSDDLDELDAALRRAMAALDGEAPAGYFDALPERTLARLEDPTISELPGEPGWPLRAVESRPAIRDEHEHGNQNDDEGEADDDAAVFSSQIMAAVELPDLAEPEAPPRRDRAASSSALLAAVELTDPAGREPPLHGDRAASSSVVRRAAEAESSGGERPASAAAVPSSGAATGPVEAPEGAAISMTSAGSTRHRRTRRMRVAIAGIGAIAVAAVATIYVTAGDHGSRGAPPAVSTGERAATATQAAGSPGAGTAAGAVAAGSAASGGPGTGDTAGARPAGSGSLAGSAAIAPAGAGSAAAQGSGSGVVPEPVGKFSGSLGKRPGNARLPSKGGISKFDVEPSGGAGKGVVSKKLKPGKPRSDRTPLSGDDIERAMTAVAGQAQACFAGARGTAALRVTVAPSGRIARVAVTGPFAGTPVGACIERVVQAATFPAWNGAPQSFDYSYLLTD